MYRVTLPFLMILAPLLLFAQMTTSQDAWKQLRFFEGKWEGTGTGQPGTSTVRREYRFIFNGTFLLGKNTSTWAPREKTPKGEVHEDWGLFSRDRARKLFVLRQFHVEGFVNQYILDTLHTDTAAIVFVTEAIENIAPGLRAKETYKILNADEFVESFALAAPGKEFELYTETHLKRVKD